MEFFATTLTRAESDASVAQANEHFDRRRFGTPAPAARPVPSAAGGL